jgi:hypothetical protein
MSKKKQGQLKHVFLERQKKSEQHVFKKSRKKIEKTILQVLILHNIPNKKLVISSWKLKVTVKKHDKRLYNVKKYEIKINFLL